MPGTRRHVGVVAERVAEPGVLVEHVGVEEVPVGEQRIEADRGVALAEQEAVAVAASPARRGAAA